MWVNEIPFVPFQNELKNLQDAFEELDMVLDDDEMFPFLMGEIFLYQNLEDTKVCFPYNMRS